MELKTKFTRGAKRTKAIATPDATKPSKQLSGCLKIKSQEASLATVYGRQHFLESLETSTTATSSSSTTMGGTELSDAAFDATVQTATLTAQSEVKNVTSVIKFDSVQVRYYPIVLSENPACHGPGPSIEIGWAYFEHPSASNRKILVDEYEKIREKDRKRWKQMRLSCQERYKLLTRMGYNNNEIMRAALNVRRIKQERVESMTITKSRERRQERFESMLRKVSRTRNKECKKLFDDARINKNKLKHSSSRHQRRKDKGATNSFYDKFLERKQKKHRTKRRASKVSRRQ